MSTMIGDLTLADVDPYTRIALLALSRGDLPLDLVRFYRLIDLLAPSQSSEPSGGMPKALVLRRFDQISLGDDGRSLIEAEATWAALVMERERLRVISILETAYEPVTVTDLHRDYCYEPMQDTVVAASLIWLIIDEVVILGWDGQLMLRHYDIDQPIELALTKP